MDGKRLAPLSNRDRRNPEGGCDLLIVRPLGCGQDDAATQGQRLRRRGGMDQLVERAAGLSSELDRERDTGHAPSVSELLYYIKNYLDDVLVRKLLEILFVSARQQIEKRVEAPV